jgi:hypothetical protein
MRVLLGLGAVFVVSILLGLCGFGLAPFTTGADDRLEGVMILLFLVALIGVGTSGPLLLIVAPGLYLRSRRSKRRAQ